MMFVSVLIMAVEPGCGGSCCSGEYNDSEDVYNGTMVTLIT